MVVASFTLEQLAYFVLTVVFEGQGMPGLSRSPERQTSTLIRQGLADCPRSLPLHISALE